MHRRVFFVDRDALAEGVPERLLGCPFIVGPEDLCTETNNFLRDRFLGRWQNRQDEVSMAKRVRPIRPALSTMRQVAYQLDNFLQWLEHKGFALPGVGEQEIGDYGHEMDVGSWTTDISGVGLSPSTVAGRQLEALQLLKYLRASGFTAQPQSKASALALTRAQRRLVRRPNPANLHFPTRQRVKEHIESIGDPSFKYGARLIYECGLRAKEVCDIQLSDLGTAPPERLPRISVLGKGNKRRAVEISPHLLSDLKDYIAFERPIRAMKSRTKFQNLLLNPINGGPLSYRSLWKQFSQFDGLSPHIGRHWYAIEYLLVRWEAEKKIAKSQGLYIATDAIQGRLSLDLLALKDNLGHVNVETTQRYLVALTQFIRQADLALAYQESLLDE